MKKSILKSISLGLIGSIFLIGCSSTDVHTPKGKSHAKYIKDLKKKRLEKSDDKKIDLEKFCFEDNKSIHYKASERCK